MGIWNLDGNLRIWTGENSNSQIHGNWEFELRGQRWLSGRTRCLYSTSSLATVGAGPRAQGVRVSKISKFCKIFVNFWRARSRLYQNEILQENMRLTAFFKLYKICILLHRCNLKILAKNRFEKSAFFVKIQQKFCKCRKICKILPNFKKYSWIIL